MIFRGDSHQHTARHSVCGHVRVSEGCRLGMQKKIQRHRISDLAERIDGFLVAVAAGVDEDEELAEPSASCTSPEGHWAAKEAGFRAGASNRPAQRNAGGASA